MTYLFIARFLARGALIGARRCSSAKRRAAFADSDPGHREARAGRVRQHDKLLRIFISAQVFFGNDLYLGLSYVGPARPST
jgi:hypothetical protein